MGRFSSLDEFMPYPSRRSVVVGTRGMAAASQPLAVAAGIKMLDQGGNAADAAVAMAAVLAVTEPGSTGLGGDCFALYYEASTCQVYALNGSGRAPRALTLERLRREGFSTELPPFHPYTITVPGACAGWCDLVGRFGRLSLAAILEPSIELAERGFAVAPLTAYFWQRGAETQLRHALNGGELLMEGRAPRAGEVFRNPNLARVLQQIATHGKKAFYEGPIAEAIVDTVQKAGGCLALEDLAAHHSTWDKPLAVTYRHFKVWECPPNGQGLTALLALNILKGYDLTTVDPLSSQRLHLQIEALRLAFADAFRYIADPAWGDLPSDALLSDTYAAERRALIHPQRALMRECPGEPLKGSDTVYFCVVDEMGNACSMVNSNYMGFGTGIVPRGCGFSLQNRGLNFSLDPNHPNALQPGKRPYHTIIPALVTHEEDDTLFAVVGVMGGFMQPQGHVQVITALVDDGLDPQSALDRPRFCVQVQEPGGRVAVEEGIPEPTLAALATMGHPIERVSGMGRALFGRGQIILRDRESGVLWGGSDPRADGCALAQI
ncbi:gamma-glutamyltransferase [Thermanaerothrix sp.]|uniref:gamma-glutamyltransferase n=1 Tax=Thermanaerothrix sp. TaxID=2972675 RepID=UPI002ADDE9EE|nr:gamma-glutamyltransferase [Thermanaerothrix sp.]